jgi:flagellar biosynthesis protein FlhG
MRWGRRRRGAGRDFPTWLRAARLSDALAPARTASPDSSCDPGARPPAVVADAVLLAHVDALEARFDLVVVDAPHGTQARGLFFAAAATDVLLVVTPQEAALRQAGTLMRLLATRCGRRELLVLPNACQGPDDATAIGHTLATLAGRSPHVRVLPLGWIPFDDAVSQARRARRTLVTVAPEAPAARALVGVAARLETLAPSRPTGGAQFFFQSLIAQGRAA